MDRDAAGRLCTSRALVSLDLGGPPSLRKLNQSLRQSVPDEVLGGAQVHNASLRVGRHQTHCIDGANERMRVVGFELRFWGHGSPRNSEKLIAQLPAVPAIQDLRFSLDELVGPTEILHMVYA